MWYILHSLINCIYSTLSGTLCYLIYSSLFSSVTWMFPPSGLSSWVVTSPRISLSTEKNISRPHSSILLSLKKPSKSSWNNVLLNHLPNKHVNVIHFCGWKCSLLTWSTWASCRTPDRWIPGLWEPEVYSRCACKMAERSRCLWTSHETGPDREKMTIILPVFKKTERFHSSPLQVSVSDCYV